MARQLEVFHRITQIGIIPAIRPSNPVEAVRAAKAICDGGITVIEVSMAMPDALGSLEAIVKTCGAQMVVGAGTVVDTEGVRTAVLSGAQFIVTPGFSLETIDKAHELQAAIFAGALTPTEVQMASRSGAEAVKLFPCYAMGGPRYLRSLRGQYPEANLIASGGVGLENCSDYIRAGACAIGVGAEIADTLSMVNREFGVMTVRARRLFKAVTEAQALWNANPLTAASRDTHE